MITLIIAIDFKQSTTKHVTQKVYKFKLDYMCQISMKIDPTLSFQAFGILISHFVQSIIKILPKY